MNRLHHLGRSFLVLMCLAGFGCVQGCAGTDGHARPGGDPFRDGKPVAAVVQALAPPGNAFLTSDRQIVPGVDNQGWWSWNQTNFVTATNYATGRASGSEAHSYLTFDLSTLDLTGRSITSAALQVEGGLANGNDIEPVDFYDVSTDPITLNTKGSKSQAIFDDLGSGESYGRAELRADFPQTVAQGLLWMPLNEAARADIAAARGGYFSVGMALESLSGLLYESAFGYTTSEGVQQLVLCFDTDADGDGDDVCDVADDCPEVANAEQADTNSDGVGDACADDDGDGLLDPADNCPFAANPEQANVDGDPAGDACDNCLSTATPTQGDHDSDETGDACDNCPADWNPGQDDWNADGVGDVCDDSDGDGTTDDFDNCRDVANEDQLDSDYDTVGDACDATPIHGLGITRVTASPATTTRNPRRHGTFDVAVGVRNLYDTPERLDVLVGSGVLPEGCTLTAEPTFSRLYDIEGLGRVKVKLRVDVACTRTASRGTHDVQLQVVLDPINTTGYESDSSDNYATVTTKLMVR